MTKKRVKKTSSTSRRRASSSRKKESGVEETLIKNLIELQKVHVDLAEKFDQLSKEISHILALFETAARNFAKNAPMGEYEKDKEFLQKIDKLLDQNKTLAKGLTLMEERLRERMYGGASKPEHGNESPSLVNTQPPVNRNRPLPKF